MHVFVAAFCISRIMPSARVMRYVKIEWDELPPLRKRAFKRSLVVKPSLTTNASTHDGSHCCFRCSEFVAITSDTYRKRMEECFTPPAPLTLCVVTLLRPVAVILFLVCCQDSHFIVHVVGKHVSKLAITFILDGKSSRLLSVSLVVVGAPTLSHSRPAVFSPVHHFPMFSAFPWPSNGH